MELNIWWALGFMFAGFAIAHVFNAMAWQKYYEGKSEGKRDAADGKYSRDKADTTGAITCASRTTTKRNAAH